MGRSLSKGPFVAYHLLKKVMSYTNKNKAFQEKIRIHSTVLGGIGRAYDKRCGVPQGDALSMMPIALIMRP